jgi:hypothetical protein
MRTNKLGVIVATIDPNPFEVNYVVRSRRPHCAINDAGPQSITVQFSPTLDADAAKWRRKGYSCIGLSDVVSKAGLQGLSHLLEAQAERVGAQAVLFCIWPAKLRSVRRDERGEIDLDAVVADSPASFSPRSYAVTRALFFMRSQQCIGVKFGT